MDEDSIEVQLNVFSTQGNTEQTKRRKMKKPERIKHIKNKKQAERNNWRKEAAISEDTPNILANQGQETADQNEKEGLSQYDQVVRKKRKRTNPDESSNESKKQKGVKFSSLFKNNPEIPEVHSEKVKQVKEVVFTGNSFKDLELHPFMVSNLEQKMGFSQMTSVQKASIPHILEGRDTLVKSQTGSGKTLSYAVPIIESLQSKMPKISRCDGPFAIVIVPTRELALQSFDTFQKLIRPYTWIVPGCIMGGEKKKSEKARLRKGVNVLVSTPGRLMDHLQHTLSLQLDNIKWLVIDEADRLLDLGFEKDVRQIVEVLEERCATKRQTILVSATLSPGVERLAGMSLQDPVTIDVTENAESQVAMALGMKESQAFSTPKSLQHNFVVVPSKLRLVTLASFLLWKCKLGGKIIVFFATQDSVDFHHNVMINNIAVSIDEDGDEDVMAIFRLHGDMLQKERTNVFLKFAEETTGVLLCTDVAARGLDLPKVDWIVQYNAPGAATDYIHRAGRTARIGTQGNALIFLDPKETNYIKVLNDCQISLHEIKMDEILHALKLHADQLPEISKGQRASSTQECAIALQKKFEHYVHENQQARITARKAYQSFLRSYTTYPQNMKYIFHVKNLHLGHLAKSFGLTDAPSQVGTHMHKDEAVAAKRKQKLKAKSRSGPDHTGEKPRGMKAKMNSMMLSEFSSGFDSAKQGSMFGKTTKGSKFGKTKKKKLR